MFVLKVDSGWAYQMQPHGTRADGAWFTTDDVTNAHQFQRVEDAKHVALYHFQGRSTSVQPVQE